MRDRRFNAVENALVHLESVGKYGSLGGRKNFDAMVGSLQHRHVHLGRENQRPEPMAVVKPIPTRGPIEVVKAWVARQAPLKVLGKVAPPVNVDPAYPSNSHDERTLRPPNPPQALHVVRDAR